MARKLVVEIIGDADSLERAFARSSKGAQRFQASISGVGSTITRGLAGFAGITSAAYGVSQAFQAGFDEMRESRRVAAQTTAVLKSTGGVAGVTAEHVEELADALLRKTAIDDEQIQSAENLLLTFTNVRNVVGKNNDIFDQATQAALDMSTALGTDATQAALQLGKALQDPVRGVTALRRAGVALSQAQQAQIRNLVRSGRLLDAQKIILRELSTEFAGSAEAAGRADGGLQLLQHTIENFLGMVVEKFMPNIQAATTALQKWFDEPGNVDKVASDVEDLAGAFAGFVSGLAEANRKGDEFMENLRRGMKRAGEETRAGLFGVLERLPSPGPLANWFRKEREESLKELGQLKIEAAAAAVDIGAALKIHDRPTVAEMFPPAAGGAAPPGGGGAGGGLRGVTAAQRNRWFDAMIGRKQERAKSIADLRAIVRDLEARLKITKDITRRMRLQDEIWRTQQQIADRSRQAQEERRATQLGWLEFALERAEVTKTVKDDLKAMRAIEAYWKERIRQEGRTLENVQEYWRIQQQIRDLNKKNADLDPVAGLRQVSSAGLARFLAAGTGLGPAGLRSLGRNIAGAEIQPVYVSLQLDGREIGRAATTQQARTGQRTAKQTSGRR